MITRVYVAGASAELERAKTAMDWVREMPGLALAYDWVADVQKHRVEGGKSDADLTNEQRFWLASNDASAVSECDTFWLLVPNVSVVTVGAWFELGVAVSTGRRVVVSGIQSGQHLFCSLAESTFAVDHDAKAWILEARHG